MFNVWWLTFKIFLSIHHNGLWFIFSIQKKRISFTHFLFAGWLFDIFQWFVCVCFTPKKIKTKNKFIIITPHTHTYQHLSFQRTNKQTGISFNGPEIYTKQQSQLFHHHEKKAKKKNRQTNN